MTQAEYNKLKNKEYPTVLEAHKVALRLSNATGAVHMAFNLDGVNTIKAVKSWSNK